VRRILVIVKAIAAVLVKKLKKAAAGNRGRWGDQQTLYAPLGRKTTKAQLMMQ